MLLEVTEPLAEDVGGDLGDVRLQLPEPARAVEQSGDDQQRPAVADDRECFGQSGESRVPGAWGLLGRATRGGDLPRTDRS
jgi:hypothetical protein